ncbi:hypothetical protein COO91_03589 [Nostoc flagelliforme CCNUN1]|uniref:Uncharacterized protein n=1 Tax=Nostoc flagelliforme CCNUN1 TaxID=2038116 RepID=A0A2K8SQR1_9NOSO|nr:hypothetical protein COO91_03589 [Nostoc flagelliforme CCNUN1]
MFNSLKGNLKKIILYSDRYREFFRVNMQFLVWAGGNRLIVIV